MRPKYALILLAIVMFVTFSFLASMSRRPAFITQYLATGEEKIWQCDDFYYSLGSEDITCVFDSNFVVLAPPYKVHRK